MLARPISEQAYLESTKHLPGGVSSPVRAFQGVNLSPMIVDRGKGPYVYDVDGHRYVDYCMSWGALMLGHAHPSTLKAIYEQMERGSSFGITTVLEAKMAQEISSCMPSIEKIRFVSSGTEATMSALRLARGYTNKSYCIKFIGNYHGHADSFLVKAGSGVLSLAESSSLGVLKETVQHTICLPYNDVGAVQKIFADNKEIAAVIVEPIAANMGVVPATKEFLEALRFETTKAGALLIFDEVITGFRVGLGGAQELFGITPDLTCLGKIIGGGLPLAAFGGKKEIMDLLAPLGGVYQAGTLSGNPLALSAGLATLAHLKEKNFYVSLEEKAAKLLEPLLELEDRLCIQRVGSFFTVFFGVKKVKNHQDLSLLSSEEFCDFYHFLFDRGVYFSPAQQEASFLSAAHDDEVLSYTRDVLEEFTKR